MGMCLELCTISQGNILKLLADPPQVWRVIAPHDGELESQARLESGRMVAGTPLTLSDGEGVVCNLKKAWHGIHYLLSQAEWESEWPWDFLVSGGSYVGSTDVGYGVARVFAPPEARTIREALETINEEKLRQRYDADQMMELSIYPETWDRGASELEWCLEGFREMVAYIQKVADEELGLLVYLC